MIKGRPSPERKILGRKTEKAVYGVAMPHYINGGQIKTLEKAGIKVEIAVFYLNL